MAKSRSYGYDLEARIAQALRECGLGEKEIKQVAGKIKTYVEFIGPLKADSSFWNFRSKLEKVVEAFSDEDLTYDEYLQAALEQPQLFYQSPDTIEFNIRDLVRRFEPEGLTVKAYLKAALEQPQLFYRSPDTIEQHIHFVQELEKRGVIKIPSKYGSVLEWLLANPTYMAYGSDHYRLKFYYAKLLDKPAALKNLKMPKKKVISELEQAFGSIHRVEKGKTIIDFEKLHSLYIEKYNKSPAEGAYHAYLWNENT
ncbi:MAG: hypothetical protein QXE64_00430 [Candidatus Pacearchaeota archaeon]